MCFESIFTNVAEEYYHINKDVLMNLESNYVRKKNLGIKIESDFYALLISSFLKSYPAIQFS